MRGGTSRGPYFLRRDLLEDHETLARVLTAAMGAGHPLNIDGLGGGASVTTKVAMLSRAEDDWADVDYFFAQLNVEDDVVDFKPTCGNILCGVGSVAIEMGLVEAQPNETMVRIRAVNTGARIEAVIQTNLESPDAELQVIYDGDGATDGVPGTAAPVQLKFMGVVGSGTGAFLPTGNLRDTIHGVTVTCMDVTMPMVIGRAEDFGLTGYETRAELDSNTAFFEKMEPLRREADRLMGMGDVAGSVTPQFGVLAAPREGGDVSARYFVPDACHPSMAVSGGQCLSACLLTEGTIADGMNERPVKGPAMLRIEHSMGVLEVLMDFERKGEETEILSAGLVRTCR